MAKGKKTGLSVHPVPAPVSTTIDLSKVMQNIGLDGTLVEYNVSQKPGQTVISGTTSDGQHIHMEKYQANGLKTASVSVFTPGSIEERQAEAKRLRSTGLSQQAIAGRLGVSQKTISNDLNQ